MKIKTGVRIAALAILSAAAIAAPTSDSFATRTNNFSVESVPEAGMCNIYITNNETKPISCQATFMSFWAGVAPGRHFVYGTPSGGECQPVTAQCVIP